MMKKSSQGKLILKYGDLTERWQCRYPSNDFLKSWPTINDYSSVPCAIRVPIALLKQLK